MEKRRSQWQQAKHLGIVALQCITMKKRRPWQQGACSPKVCNSAKKRTVTMKNWAPLIMTLGCAMMERRRMQQGAQFLVIMAFLCAKAKIRKSQWWRTKVLIIQALLCVAMEDKDHDNKLFFITALGCAIWEKRKPQQWGVQLLVVTVVECVAI